jgi:Raf kinase inhibitor-like YbhB/YbcL family protein
MEVYDIAMRRVTLKINFINVVLFVFIILVLIKLFILFLMPDLKLNSPALKNGTVIPEMYTCKGINVNPPLVIADAPIDTKSFALIFEDPDAPFQTWDHWLLWNIDPKTIVIIENTTPPGATSGTTSFGNQKYEGPCPPEGSRHRYVFKLFALDTTLTLPPEARKSDLEEVIQGHILDQDEFSIYFP